MNLVYYSQEDLRWKNQMYSNIRDSNQTIGLTGCGPTSFAMVYSSFTGKSLLPPEAAKYSVDHGFRTSENGTSWALFPSIAKSYGLSCAATGSLNAVKKALSDGALVIASMSAGGHFTRGGHFIVLTGAHDGLIDVMDPNPDNDNYKHDGMIAEGVKNDGRVSGKESVFQSEARQYWIFTYRNEEDEPMNDAERKAFEELGKRVAQLEADKKTPAPDWFLNEFGSADLGGIIEDPHGTTDFWRGLAVVIRAARQGKLR
ncbi:C39 family peptidase [Cohnella candidum]|uniref:Peptidase C39-like domain-containing protein n=1 Tax=Cohnella candidum TaxID=2674991 RepID=A0A3G3JWB0_9BACL|nr:C39 family peptidase [Cohnella candidum]AYQ72518.1 hypothetical protein EAV92_08015 [Cohnella candidum]